VAERAAAVDALARTISGLRAERGLSQEAVAERANISKNHLGKIENGETNPGFVAVVSIAEALEMSMGEFVDRYQQLARGPAP
jgi:transcriptional regulator with XRE-family HTH domain